ncbi:MAG: PrgI family protein [Lachnospiraceae bacterium]|nr:PrgI family protein [Lachnospiraceae bacterium]
MAYVTVPKDLSKVKTKVLFNLTKRQLICFSAGAAIGVPLFFLLRNRIGVSTAAMVMMIAMVPAFLLAMYEKNGQPMEKVLRNVINVLFLRPKQRPYRTNNFYSVLERQNSLDMEVRAIVQKKTVPRRKEGDSGRHRQGKADKPQGEICAGQHSVSANVAGRHLPGK